jgi:hypothetical protein
MISSCVFFSFSQIAASIPYFLDQTCIYLVYKESSPRVLGIFSNVLNALGVLSYSTTLSAPNCGYKNF